MACVDFKKKDRMVRINKTAAALLAALILFGGCENGRSVRLSLDFSKRSQWRYSLHATIGGTIVSADTQRTFTSAAACSLSGSPDPKSPAVLHVAVAGVSVSSDILGPDEIENLKDQAKGVRLTCALDRGIIAPDDSSAMPLVRIGEWDLYKDLAKTIPALPAIAVRAGSTWDRERTIPLDTKLGAAVGHLYQTFWLDSIYAGGTGILAALSWKFTYRVEFRNRRSVGLLDSIPSVGSGTGSAIVNVTRKTLDRASIHFEVPAATQGSFRISWKEDIILQLAN